MVKKNSKSHRKHGSPAHAKGEDEGNSYVFGIVVFLILVAVVAGIIWLSSKAGESRISAQSEVAAVVDGDEITMAYLDEQYSRVPPMYQAFITKSNLLNQTINELLLLHAAEARGIDVTEEDVSAEIDAAIEQAGIAEAELDERLAEQNLSREFLEDLYQKQLAINKLLEQEVFPDVAVSDSEVQEAYDANIRAAHILVESEKEALDIIDDLKTLSLSEIQDGFMDIAKEKSIDPSAALNGGDLGEFSKGMMVPDFEKAAFALEEYAFTAEPIQTQFGYHIILRLPKESTYEEQYAALKESLLIKKKADAVPQYLEQLRSEADIQVFYRESSPVAE